MRFSELNFWRGVALLSCLLSLGVPVWYWLHPVVITQHPTVLFVCGGVSAPSAGAERFTHCDSEGLVFPSDSACNQAKAAVVWAIHAGARMTPPWVAADVDRIVLECAPKEKVPSRDSDSI